MNKFRRGYPGDNSLDRTLPQKPDYDILAQETLLYKPTHRQDYLDTDDAIQEFRLAFEKGGKSIRDKEWDRVDKHFEMKQFRDNPLRGSGIPLMRLTTKDLEKQYLVNIPTPHPVPKRQWNKHLRETNERMLKKHPVPYTHQVINGEDNVINEENPHAREHLRTNNLRREINMASFKGLDTDDIEMEVQANARVTHTGGSGFLKYAQVVNVEDIIPAASDFENKSKKVKKIRAKKIRHIPISVMFDEEDRTATIIPRRRKKGRREDLLATEENHQSTIFIPFADLETLDPKRKAKTNIKSVPIRFDKVTDVEAIEDRSQTINDIKKVLGVGRIDNKLRQELNEEAPDIIRLMEGEEVDPQARVRLPNIKAVPERYSKSSEVPEEYQEYDEQSCPVGKIRLTDEEISTFSNVEDYVLPEPDDDLRVNDCLAATYRQRGVPERFEKMHSIPITRETEITLPPSRDRRKISKLSRRHFEEEVNAADIQDQIELEEEIVPGIKKYI